MSNNTSNTIYSESYRAISCSGGVEAGRYVNLSLTRLIFLHRSIMRILKISVTQVIDDHIKNTEVHKMFYHILKIQKQITNWQLTYIGKIFCREESHIPTRLRWGTNTSYILCYIGLELS